VCRPTCLTPACNHALVPRNAPPSVANSFVISEVVDPGMEQELAGVRGLVAATMEQYDASILKARGGQLSTLWIFARASDWTGGSRTQHSRTSARSV